MSLTSINRQTEAEKDTYLIDCFYDTGIIKNLIEEKYSIVTGRKGTGKTAIARFLENKYSDFGLDYATRISIRELTQNKDLGNQLDTLLFFILVKTVQKLLENKLFISEYNQYWIDFLQQNGLQDVSDYQSFIAIKKSNTLGFKISAAINSMFAKIGTSANTTQKTEESRAIISSSPNSLMTSLTQSLPKDKNIIILVDDLSDHLDSQEKDVIREEIKLIENFLFRLSSLNSSLEELGIPFRYVSLLRDDLFEFMEGSNINKLRSDSLQIEWDEKSFAGLLIRRLPFYQSNLEKSLENPILAIREQFPDNIFTEFLKGTDIKRYSSNFYAYMVAISFNRPRDFLKFCYAMRDRLSMRGPATTENIKAAEIEYSDYFMKELKDELYLASKILDFNASYDGINTLVDILGNKDSGFNSTQLRTEISQYLGEKTSIGKKKIEYFIYQLWWYGVIGFHESKRSEIIHYRYHADQVALIIERIKDYIFFLHKGLLWFVRKKELVSKLRK